MNDRNSAEAEALRQVRRRLHGEHAPPGSHAGSAGVPSARSSLIVKVIRSPFRFRLGPNGASLSPSLYGRFD
jgi:hypothetical protein